MYCRMLVNSNTRGIILDWKYSMSIGQYGHAYILKTTQRAAMTLLVYASQLGHYSRLINTLQPNNRRTRRHFWPDF